MLYIIHEKRNDKKNKDGRKGNTSQGPFGIASCCLITPVAWLHPEGKILHNLSKSNSKAR